MVERLTTLAAVKQWLGIKDSNSDVVLNRLIVSASQAAINYLNRDGIGAQNFTQNFKGNGKSSMLLRNWPIVSVSQVGINGTGVTASIPGNVGLPGSGYVISDARGGQQSIDLYGYDYPYRYPCQIIYRAGYEAVEPYIIEGDDAGNAMDYVPLAGLALSDQGVKDGNGNPWVPVTSNPATGQYVFNADGTYSFSKDDIGKAVVIDFTYCPWDLMDAVTQWIGETMRRKERIGVLSKTLAGQETVTFDRSGMSEIVKGHLQPYVNNVPI